MVRERIIAQNPQDNYVEIKKHTKMIGTEWNKQKEN